MSETEDPDLTEGMKIAMKEYLDFQTKIVKDMNIKVVESYTGKVTRVDGEDVYAYMFSDKDQEKKIITTFELNAFLPQVPTEEDSFLFQVISRGENLFTRLTILDDTDE